MREHILLIILYFLGGFCFCQTLYELIDYIIEKSKEVKESKDKK